MSGVSSVLGDAYNFSAVQPAEPPPAPPVTVVPASTSVAVPLVLPSANEVQRVRTSSSERKVTATPAEWKGVSALSDIDLNANYVSEATVGAKAPVLEQAEAAIEVPTQKAPVLLPSAAIKPVKESRAAMEPFPIVSSWQGVSAQMGGDYNHPVAHDASDIEYPYVDNVAQPAVDAAPVAVERVDVVPTASREVKVRRSSREMAAYTQPLSSYGGVASEIAHEYNTEPSPEFRRSRTASKDVPVAHAYPAGEEAPNKQSTQYDYDLAVLRAQKEAAGKIPSATHHGYSPLSSIVG